MAIAEKVQRLGQLFHEMAVTSQAVEKETLAGKAAAATLDGLVAEVDRLEARKTALAAEIAEQERLKAQLDAAIQAIKARLG